MTTISINLNDTLLHRLLGEALAKNLSLNDYVTEIFDDNIVEVAAVEETDEMLSVAVTKARAQPSGAEFILRHLFTDAEWANVQQPRSFGRQFRKIVESGPSPIAKHIGKTEHDNKAMYRRT